ncbi:PREDICTED: uncharacterized protein LOC108559218 [Nicrophorus vespilloides]|uniref:Uncharacterized protein LOC108559218 n=1 Tax=Nicrophorus vespilloides TaxID=110193 RepID=A0ABM1MBF8_NICVS|nr:PREDICTED: uncharacterized protein LOC108559218 [Nicrophorus vespilloides]
MWWVSRALLYCYQSADWLRRLPIFLALLRPALAHAKSYINIASTTCRPLLFQTPNRPPDHLPHEEQQYLSTTMKCFAILMALFVYTNGQRPSYAGTGPIGRPSLASRFKDTTEAPTTIDLANRMQDTSTEKIPVDARGDSDLVNRLNQWPRENRPFWLINAEHIEASRNPNRNQLQNRNNFDSSETIPIRPTAQRSSFLAPIN